MDNHQIEKRPAHPNNRSLQDRTARGAGPHLTKLKPVSLRNLIKRLKELGFEGPYQGGRHPYMVKEGLVLTIPNPHKKSIGVDLLSRILKQANITREEWLRKR